MVLTNEQKVIFFYSKQLRLQIYRSLFELFIGQVMLAFIKNLLVVGNGLHRVEQGRVRNEPRKHLF